MSLRGKILRKELGMVVTDDMEAFKIGKILNLEKWQEIQDGLSKMTKMAIITVDYKGVPVTGHSGCSGFCSAVRNDPELRALCQKCDSRAGLEAVRSNEPYIYLCHFKIVDVAIPITVDGNYIGAVMAGQVRLSDQEEEAELEQIISRTSSIAEYSSDYDALPVMSYGEIKQIADTLFLLCNYVIEEALEKNFLIGMPELKQQNIKKLKEDMDSMLSNAFVSQQGEELISATHPLLRPAIEYIYGNKDMNPSQKEMAELCKISPSYFSRLFSGEFGDSYSSFVSKLKIKWATELLLDTDLSVAQISDALGFSDNGYFIKKFKKIEGVTPLVYRKFYKRY